MQIQQFRYSADNFSYLVHDRTSAIAIDPGAVQEILSFLEQADLKLAYVVNTHMHPDHTPGNREIIERTKAVFIDNQNLRRMQAISMGETSITILHTPGHTEDSLTFQAGKMLITGDTLFNGTVGNCFSGDLKAFYTSIKMLLEFPADTKIYAGHDYVQYAMSFARSIEPDNADIDEFLKGYNPRLVRSTLADELKVNPYVRFNDAKLVAGLASKGLPIETEFNRWKSLMEYY